MEQDLVIRRRRIGPEDLRLIQQLIEQEGKHGRSHLSNRLCELWNWRQANGRFRQIACRDLLRRLEARGLIRLPPPLSGARRGGYRNQTPRLDLLNGAPLQGTVGEFRPELRLELVGEAQPSALYKGLMGMYHYWGYQQATGAQLKYLAYFQEQPVACLSFGPAAWKIGLRDQFIGWSAQARRQPLEWVVNNERLVMVPWVQMAGLASVLLSRVVPRLRRDWLGLSGHDLALAESFVDPQRFAGSAYAAANWRCLGPIVGRGRNDRTPQPAASIKTIWLSPLRPDFRAWLCQAD